MRKEEAKFQTKFISGPGTNSTNNDYFGYVELDNYAVWALADGYDGEEGADIAARIAVESAIEFFILRPEMSAKVLKESIEYAHAKVVERQEESERYSLMHASFVIVISNYHSIMWAHVGNARFYHIRNGEIFYQTKDDSIAQILVNKEALNKNDIKEHRQRNDLTQAIGDYVNIKPNVQKKLIKLQEGDILCLSSIGTWENLSESEIEIELSKVGNIDQWLKKLEGKIMATPRSEVQNYTFVATVIDSIASPEEQKKSMWPIIKKILTVLVILFLIWLTLALFQWRKRSNLYNEANIYVEQADESITLKNFNDADENYDAAIVTYEKGMINSGGIIGWFRGKNGNNNKINKKVEEIRENKEGLTTVKDSFNKITLGDEDFKIHNYEEARRNYENALFALQNITFKKDDLKIDETIAELETKILSTEQLSKAKVIEESGDEMLVLGNLDQAREKYDEAIDIYILYGRGDYVVNLERKIEDLNTSKEAMYSTAIQEENKGDLLAGRDQNAARQAYLNSRQIYQSINNTTKVAEIDSKISELSNEKLAKLMTAEQLITEGDRALGSRDNLQAIAQYERAQAIYDELGESQKSKMVNRLVDVADQDIKTDEDIEAKVSEIKEYLKQKEEEQRLEKKQLEEAFKLEREAAELSLQKRYPESISKYEEAQKLYEELGFSEKAKNIDEKIEIANAFYYEFSGDNYFGNKEWKQAMESYNTAKEMLDKFIGYEYEKERIYDKFKKAKIKDHRFLGIF